MRWEELFADLEGESEAEAEAERRSEVADRIRSESGRLRLLDRLRPALAGQSAVLRIGVAGQLSVSGRLRALGSDWLLLGEEGGAEVLVPVSAVTFVSGLGRESTEPGSEGEVAPRLGLRYALRTIARDRSMVSVAGNGANEVTGLVAYVGSDFLELRVTAEAGTDTRLTIPLAAVSMVRRR